MKKQFKVLISLFICVSTGIYAQWVQKANLPGTPRSGAVSWSINNKLYVVGGGPGQDLREYDPVTNAWTVKAALPWPSGSFRYLSMGFVINGNGYICSGTDGAGTYVNDLWMYDPVTNTWSAKAAFPGPARVLGFAFSIGNSAFVGSGGDSQIFFKDMYEYDASNDGWTQRSDFPGGFRAHVIGAGLGNFGYAGAGVEYTGGSSVFTNRADLFKYNPLSDSWTPVTTIPGQPRLSATAFSSDSLIYVGLGSDSQVPTQGNEFNDMYTYNPVSNNWVNLPNLATARCQATGAFVKGQPYVLTGRNTTTNFPDLWTINAVVVNPTSLTEINPQDNMKVFPTYADNKVTVNVTDGKTYDLKMVNAMGQSISNLQGVNNSMDIDCSALPDGIYIISFSDGKNSRNFKVIVDHQ